MAWRARAARRPTWHPVKGRRTVEIRHPGGHHEERRIPHAHHSRAGRAVTPLSEGRRSDGVRLGVRGARVSVTARIEAPRTGGGRLGGTAVVIAASLPKQARGTIRRRLRHGDRDRSSSERGAARGAAAAGTSAAWSSRRAASRGARSAGASAARPSRRSIIS